MQFVADIDVREGGQELAHCLPDARFVPLESENHTLLPGTQAYEESLAEMEAFLDGIGKR